MGDARHPRPAIALVLFAAHAAWPPAPAAAQPVPRFDVGVELVRLSVTARDGRGELVHRLRAEDFEVAEDGVPQSLHHFGQHEVPISVVVLFDKSASMMRGDKMMHAKDAVVNFVRALGKQDEVLLVAFSEGIDALGDFGLDAKAIERATKDIEAESSTRLYDAVVEGSRVIAGPGRKEKRAILILTDGEDTGSVAKIEEAAEAVRRAGAPVYAIGIELEETGRTDRGGALWRRLDTSAPVGALRRLTDGTGGWTYPIAAAKRCKEVCIRVAQELRHQYLLGYYPASPAADGAWRNVEVRTGRTGVVLSTRAGYLAGRQ